MTKDLFAKLIRCFFAAAAGDISAVVICVVMYFSLAG